MEGSFVVVGRFTRVIKSDGTLLFKPFLRDTAFLSGVTHLYHAVFHTAFQVVSIVSVSRGFHIRIAEVEKPYEAEYLVGEEFVLPRLELVGKTLDAFIGFPVVTANGNKVLGTVSSVSRTPRYPLLTVSGNQKEFDIPFAPDVARLDNDHIVLLCEEIHAY